MAALDATDRQEAEVAREKGGRLKDKITALRRQMAAFKSLKPLIEAAPDRQLSLSDPDAASWPPAVGEAGRSATTSRWCWMRSTT